MINPDKRKAVYLLHNEGMSIRSISRHMNISTSTIIAIISQKGEIPAKKRKDKKR